MRKSSALLMIAALLLFAACGGSTTSSPTTTTPPTTTIPTTTQMTTPTQTTTTTTTIPMTTTMSTTATTPTITTQTTTTPIPVTTSAWEVSVELVETTSSLDLRLGTPFNKTTKFYLEEPSKTFLLVSFSLMPMTEDNTLDMKEVMVTHSGSGRFYPVGLKHFLDWTIGTSGTGQIGVISDEEITLECDLIFNADNDYGIKNDDLLSHQVTLGGSSIMIFQGPMFTFAYVIPSENISSGQLWLELPGSEPVELIVTN